MNLSYRLRNLMEFLQEWEQKGLFGDVVVKFRGGKMVTTEVRQTLDMEGDTRPQPLHKLEGGS